MIKSRCTAVAAALACTASLAAAQTATARPAAWQQVGDGITSGISGIAVAPGSRAGATDVLVVRDNKRDGENRLATIRLRTDAKPEVRPLAWQGGEPPADLEALDSIPGRPGEYVALTSSGKGYHLRTTGSDTARVLGTFTVPGATKNDNYEGFALTSRAHRLVAVWADRGENDRPGTLHAATLDLGRHTFSAPVTAPFHAPYPATNVRHISDVKAAPSGALTVSSASDTGDDGPFDSAVYDAGKVTVDRNGAVRLSVRRSPAPVARYTGHKIEALACLPHSREGVLGTDDENAGGAIRTVSGTLCRFR
ncbi:hypothetical protein ACH4OW_06570 [Streptomyces sp. NPDC017056]|uniref:hypothetical protein n=1 Tax=Streptomyces sp. NPDC017056 TaxID=3364973 RepID=UPI0037BA5BA6